MEYPECPNDVKIRGDILYMNGFSGFQAPHGGGKDRFIICFHNNDDIGKDIDKIKIESKSNTLKEGYWIGRDYLSIHWTEYNKIINVLNTLLKFGYSFQVQTKGMVSFDYNIDKMFSFELLEEKVIIQTNKLIEYKLYEMIDDCYCEEWNYITQKGKEFSITLKDKLKYNYDKSRTNFYKWPIFQNYDKNTLIILNKEEKKIEIKKDKNEMEEIELCMVCLDKEPDTMVLPCEHCVVCKECSIVLEKTINSMKCIKCRQNIENKLY